MIYEKEYLKELVFPVGGIGTGSIGIDGAGLLRDFEIFNRPSKCGRNGYTHFAVRAEKTDGEIITKVICSDITENLTGIYGVRNAHSHGYGFGLTSSSMNGFPHFKRVTADCEYPFGRFTFSDDDFPGTVTLTAWNPLIPHDSFNSSIPAAFFDLKYDGEKLKKLSFAFSFGCLFEEAVNTVEKDDGFTAVRMKSTEDENSPSYGDITILCKGGGASAQKSWYRGGWCDNIVTYWRELTEGKLPDRSYDSPGCDHATIMQSFGGISSAASSFILTWNVPVCENYWRDPEEGKKNTWRNYYATRFASSSDSALYCLKNRETLLEKTEIYRNAMFSQNLPQKIVEAAASTLSVLRSPTVLRLEDGSFYGFEGSGENSGSCEGCCSHVWNYAYALCFLFPELERSLRDNELKYELQPDGALYFRMGLPAGRECALDFPCMDGQAGTVIKMYREWKISGDTAWLRERWDKIKAIIDFANNSNNNWRWDTDSDGFADGRMHHTLDMELFGANGWLEGMYLAALKAAQEMAEYLKDYPAAEKYGRMFANGSRRTEEELFNGEYYIQKINLSDRTLVESFDCGHYWNEEAKEIKYQIGDGCEIDQLLGQWHASVNGLGNIFDRKHAETAVNSIYKNNFKKSLRGFVNPWRLFAVNDEPGTIICTYPENKRKPAVPIPYCEECMNGFEYAFAGTLIALGEIEKGVEVASAVREKYNGRNRNPFNEIECGNNYSRSMASFALIPLLSGFSFDMPNSIIGFEPRINKNDFRCFWSAGEAFGTYEQTKEAFSLYVLGGELELEGFVPGGLEINSLSADEKQIDFLADNNRISFSRTKITKVLTGSV